MKRLAIVMAILLFFLVDNVCAQHKKTNKPRVDVRLVKLHPTVYLTFERAGKREPLYQGESNAGIWLRLHNNTRWPITFPVFGLMNKSLGEVGMYYEIESEQITKPSCDLPIGYRLMHVRSTDKLLPGESIIFSIPREHLAKGLAIRVSFNYEWEIENGFTRMNEPQHSVFFYSSTLPASTTTVK